MQVTYMLGANGHSWVVGFGVNPPSRVHHRGASIPVSEKGNKCWDALHSKLPNPNEITGALAGGPDVNGTWVDDRHDSIGNEVALDYNAAFFLALTQTAQWRKDSWQKPARG
jgi:endoglucanase